MHINNLYRVPDPISSAQQVAMARSERSLRDGKTDRAELRALTGADKTLLAAIYGEDEMAITPLAALWLDQQRRTELFDRPVDQFVLMDLHRKAKKRRDLAERMELENFTRSAMVVLDSRGEQLTDEARALRSQGGFSVYA